MATIKEHEAEIDGKLYRCKTFPASEGLVILPKLISLMGDKIANLVFAAGDEGIETLMADSKTMAAILVNIAERAEENDGLLVLRDLMKYTTFIRRHREPKTPNDPNPKMVELPVPLTQSFDLHFAGEYLHLLNVAMWVGRASFGNP